MSIDCVEWIPATSTSRCILSAKEWRKTDGMQWLTRIDVWCIGLILVRRGVFGLSEYGWGKEGAMAAGPAVNLLRSPPLECLSRSLYSLT